MFDLGIIIGVLLALVTIAGVTVGVLISQKVINVGQSSSVSEGASQDSPSPSAIPSGPSFEEDSNAGSETTDSVPSKTRSNPTATKTNEPEETEEPEEEEEEEEEEKCPLSKDLPKSAQGTYFDTTTWANLDGFNCTYTDETVGGLPVIGLFSKWDDSKRANPNVPALNKPWGDYGARPARGVNLGGWLSIEPFISPSLFDSYDLSQGVVDEYSLTKTLGKKAAEVLEKHYATFITEDDFKAIAAAGLDHLRIPFSYWVVAVYDDDPFVFRVSWRYLLRGIEWARKYGLRIKLDLHGLPGSQNSWNHSGRQGKGEWLTGPRGALHAQRSLDIHKQLATFFAQPRYKNVIAFYGLANEPAMTHEMSKLIDWTTKAYDVVKKAGIQQPQVFSDSMRGLEKWQGQLTGEYAGMVVDAHKYVIFDNALLAFKHTQKIEFACKTWTQQVLSSMNTGSGHGPTMVGEWSQADTDCTKYLNGVGNGARWIGTFSDTQGVPRCPTGGKSCDCTQANADPSQMSKDYKLFLKTWAIAQMDAYEKSWGWYYWTWKTESAPLWSYKAGIEGGILPKVAYDRDWSCASPVPDFGSLSKGI